MASSTVRVIHNQEEGAVLAIIARERILRLDVCAMIVNSHGYLNEDARCFSHRSMPNRAFNPALTYYAAGVDESKLKSQLLDVRGWANESENSIYADHLDDLAENRLVSKVPADNLTTSLGTNIDKRLYQAISISEMKI